MPHGYNGKILRVNLSNGSTAVEEPPENFYRRYFGGSALAAYYILKEMKPRIDPLSPDNVLVFSGGVLTGSPLGGFGRNCISAKSPLTGAFGDTQVGGYWGAELKHAGYDAIIIEGKAKRPTYIWIQDGKAELRDARHLWGKTTWESQKLIREELGDKVIRTAQIGPAGEKLVRFAAVMNDLHDAAGRTGMGAVMGSKNLKAIAVRGNNPPAMANPETIKAIAKWLQAVAPTSGYRLIGTLGGTPEYNQAGGLPTRNFREGVFEGADKLSAKTYMETIGAGRGSCYACALRCKHKVRVGEPYNVSPEYYGGPEFESVLSVGSTCGIDNLGAAAKANELASAYGVDTISLGVTIAFAMECFEKGILTGRETNGLELSFGNADAMLKLVEMICKREGIGNILAEGSAKAAKMIGKGAEQYAMNVKGLEVPMHGPHFKQGAGMGYAVLPTGADHTRNIHGLHLWTKPGIPLDRLKPLGIQDPLPLDDLSIARVRQFVYFSHWRTALDCMVCCIFLPYEYSQFVDIVRGVLGWETSVWELMKLGERCMNLMRVFNAREGFTSKDDRLPQRFHTPLPAGPLKGVSIDKGKMEQAIKSYYKMMVWDEERGAPKLEKLQELEIDWVANQL